MTENLHRHFINMFHSALYHACRKVQCHVLNDVKQLVQATKLLVSPICLWTAVLKPQVCNLAVAILVFWKPEAGSAAGINSMNEGHNCSWGHTISVIRKKAEAP